MYSLSFPMIGIIRLHVVYDILCISFLQSNLYKAVISEDGLQQDFREDDDLY